MYCAGKYTTIMNFRVIGGHGELDSNSGVNSQLERKILNGCPYLLLDIRDTDSYDQSHLITGNFLLSQTSRKDHFYYQRIKKIRGI